MRSMDARGGGSALLVMILLLMGTRSASAGDSRTDTSALVKRSENVRDNAVRLAERIRKDVRDQQRMDSGTARSANFHVTAPGGDFLAGQVLDAAEQYRREIAIDWLGCELKEQEEFAFVHVQPGEGADIGLALLDRDRPGTSHRIWLRTSPNRAVGTTLAHEVAHVVLNSRFGSEGPVWATEGVACQYDDAQRMATRRQILERIVRTRRWPSLEAVITAQTIEPTDEVSYGLSVALTEYLVASAGRPTFLQFVADGQSSGWETALQTNYAIGSLSELERNWQQWVITNVHSRQSEPEPGVSRWTASRTSQPVQSYLSSTTGFSTR